MQPRPDGGPGYASAVRVDYSITECVNRMGLVGVDVEGCGVAYRLRVMVCEAR